MHSLDAAKEIMHLTGGKLLDMVFIDADHSYEAVVKDIAAWRNLVAVDGILCGHDYDISRHPGVVKAVDESIKFKVIPNTSIWVLNKK
jgi:cephalosporin hydroxylase